MLPALVCQRDLANFGPNHISMPFRGMENSPLAQMRLARQGRQIFAKGDAFGGGVRMDYLLLWGAIGIVCLIAFPLIAVDVHQRLQKRNHKARGLRQTDKIQL
jgi:hypothetical protein